MADNKKKDKKPSLKRILSTYYKEQNTFLQIPDNNTVIKDTSHQMNKAKKAYHSIMEIHEVLETTYQKLCSKKS